MRFPPVVRGRECCPACKPSWSSESPGWVAECPRLLAGVDQWKIFWCLFNTGIMLNHHYIVMELQWWDLWRSQTQIQGPNCFSSCWQIFRNWISTEFLRKGKIWEWFRMCWVTSDMISVSMLWCLMWCLVFYHLLSPLSSLTSPHFTLTKTNSSGNWKLRFWLTADSRHQTWYWA